MRVLQDGNFLWEICFADSVKIEIDRWYATVITFIKILAWVRAPKPEAARVLR